MVKSTRKVTGRSSSNPVSAPKPDQQRRRIFGNKAKSSTKKKEEQGQSHFANSVWYRLTSWFWQTNTPTPNQGDRRIGTKARGSHRAGVPGDTDGWKPKTETIIVILPLLVAAAATTFFLMRWRARAAAAAAAARRPRREIETTETNRGECETKQRDDDKEKSGDGCGDEGHQRGSGSPGEQSLRKDGDARSMNNLLPRGRAGDSTDPVRPEQNKKPWSPLVPVSRSGERKVSLYDVLNGEASLVPPPSRLVSSAAALGEAGMATGSNAAAGGPSPGPGSRPLALLGNTHRASIFDRIVDIVFNEETVRRDPVDADAVRRKLGDEFRVSFQEGAMGMTVSMDPGTGNALVGKLLSQGQAFRAGVQVGDLVIGVGEHTVSSYGTVLAFMNILGRPIELRFRKVKSTGGGSGNVGVSTMKYSDLAASQGSCTMSGAESSFATAVGSCNGPSRKNSLNRKSKVTPSEASKKHLSARSPLNSGSDSSFVDKMEHGVVVTKYGKKGAAGQRVLFLDVATKSLAWRDLNSTSPGHRRSSPPPFASLLKGKRETLALSHLVEVVAGDEPDPARPSLNGSTVLRERCDESLVERSFSLQFRDRSLEITCDSKAEMRQLVTGFRNLQRDFGA